MKKDAEENAAGSKADCELYLSRPVVQHWGDWNLLKEFRKLNPLTPTIKLLILNIVSVIHSKILLGIFIIVWETQYFLVHFLTS